MSILMFALLISSSTCSPNTSSHGNYLMKIRTTSVHVVAVLSVEEEGKENIAIPWMKGRDIFHGACQAAQDINKSPDLMLEVEVALVAVLVPDCDPVKGIDLLLKVLVDPSVNVIGVTEMFCDRLAEVYSPVLSQWAKSVQNSGEFFVTKEDRVQIAPHIVPSHEDTAEAIISLLYNLNWTRLGIVHPQAGYNHFASFNYLNLANTLTSLIKAKHSHNIQISLHYELCGANLREIGSLFQALKLSEVHILVMLIPPHAATAVIQKASDEGLVWPQYVWIFVYLEPASLSLTPMWENFIFMSYRLPMPCSYNVSSVVNNYKRTPYRNLLYDSVLQLVLAWNKTIRYHRIHRPYARYNDFYSKTQKTQNRLCDITLEGKGDQVDFEESDECIFLDVAFTKHHNAFVIGYYDFSNKSISLNHSILLEKWFPFVRERAHS